MKKADLSKASTSELVARFAEIAVVQDDALLSDEFGRFNKLFQRMQEVSLELKGRPGDQRNALLALYEHANMQVRVKAAKHTLAVAPQAARDLLQAIADSNWQPQALEAGMSLINLDRGIYKPT